MDWIRGFLHNLSLALEFNRKAGNFMVSFLDLHSYTYTYICMYICQNIGKRVVTKLSGEVLSQYRLDRIAPGSKTKE